MRIQRQLKNVLMVIAVVFMAASPAVMARGKKKEEPKVEQKYPNATREDPAPNPSRSMSKKLQEMYEAAQDETKQSQARQLAEEILTAPKATAYDRAIADQTLAYQAMDQDDYPKAIELLQAAINENSLPNNTHFSLMLQVAQMLQAEDKLDEASATLKQMIDETHSDSADVLGLQGSLLYQQERCTDAIPVIKQAMVKADEQKAKKQPSWTQILMACYSELEKPEEAIALAKQQMDANPNNPQMMRNLATVYTQAEKYPEAIALLNDGKQKGLLVDEKDYKLLYQLLHAAEKEKEALAVIDEALSKGILQPSVELYRTKAEAYYFSDQPKQALEWYGKAADLDDKGDLYINQARLMYEEDRFSDAKAAAQKGLAKGVKRPGDAWIVIGSAELGLKNKAAGIAAYKKAAQYPETQKAAQSWLRSAGVK